MCTTHSPMVQANVKGAERNKMIVEMEDRLAVAEVRGGERMCVLL